MLPDYEIKQKPSKIERVIPYRGIYINPNYNSVLSLGYSQVRSHRKIQFVLDCLLTQTAQPIKQ